MNRYLEDTINALDNKAIKVIGRGIIWGIRGKYNDRIFRCVGRCIYGSKTRPHLIEISSKVFKSITEELEETIAHEYCHALAYEIYNERGHKYYWKRLMVLLGYNPERCFSSDAARNIGYNREEVKNVMTKHEYKCSCKNHYVSPQKHRKIQSGIIYICNTCRTKLIYNFRVKKV